MIVIVTLLGHYVTDEILTTKRDKYYHYDVKDWSSFMEIKGIPECYWVIWAQLDERGEQVPHQDDNEAALSNAEHRNAFGLPDEGVHIFFDKNFRENKIDNKVE